MDYDFNVIEIVYRYVYYIYSKLINYIKIYFYFLLGVWVVLNNLELGLNSKEIMK